MSTPQLPLCFLLFCGTIIVHIQIWVRDVSISESNVSLLCVLFCRWRRWRSTITAWPSAQQGLRVKPTTSALTASQNTCAGTDTLPRYCMCRRVRERKGEHKHMLPSATYGSAALYVRTCVTASWLRKIWHYIHHDPTACVSRVNWKLHTI